MSWATPLHDMLRQIGEAFDVIELRNADALDRACQTGFVWTRQPGLVCLAANREYFARACDNESVCAIIAPPAAAGNQPPDKAVVVSSRAEELYLHLHAAQEFDANDASPEVDRTAIIDDSAILRGAVKVEAGVRIGARAVISGPVILRRNASIDVGAIVGCEGLYSKDILGRRQHIPHFGGIDVGEAAFIHAGAVIVRSAIKGEATRIGPAAHIGVMANVGHDADIGEAATLSSHCVIAGRARIGARVWIGASATISNAIHVGEDARVRLGAVVIRDVPAGGDVSGNFAGDHTRSMRRYLKESRS